MISNICIVGLLKNYTKKVAKRVADALEMFYADVEDLLTFDFIDIMKAENIVGKEYIERQETNKIKTLASYENTIITLNHQSLNKEKNLNHIKNGAILVYLKISNTNFKRKISQEGLTSQEKSLLIKLENERDKLLCEYADVVVPIEGKIDNVMKLILKKIEEYYEK